MNVKAVLFDMDGVITDTDHLHFQVWTEILKQYEIELTEEMYIKHLQSRSHKEAIVSILGHKSEEEIKTISNQKNKESRKRLKKEIKIYQDTMDFIEYLHEHGYTLAVVSASSNASFVIEEIHKTRYFHFILSGTNNTDLKNKPYPDIYLHAMKKLQVKPSETLIIEDSISGITAGLRSGARVIGINRGNLAANDHAQLTITNDLHSLIHAFERGEYR